MEVNLPLLDICEYDNQHKGLTPQIAVLDTLFWGVVLSKLHTNFSK